MGSPESASPSKCTTSQSPRPNQETTSELMSRDYQKKTCPRLVMSCPLRTKMVMLIHQRLQILSELQCSFKITLDNLRAQMHKEREDSLHQFTSEQPKPLAK